MSNHDREGSHPSNRDAALERAWREASDEQPPAHLDAAIIAAARKSAPNRGEQPHTAPVRVQSRNWLTKWQPLAVAATVAGLAFVLVQMLPREHDLAPSLQRQESAPVPASAKPQSQSPSQSSSAREATDNRQAPSADGTVGLREPVAVPEQTRSQSEVLVPPATPAPPAATAKATASDTAVAARSSSAREKKLGNAASLDAAAWAAQIAALHGSGDVTAAEKSLRAFRAAAPGADAYLPDSLRDWARTVE
jgi:hypothetical protein